jgi:hypothetical protein
MASLPYKVIRLDSAHLSSVICLDLPKCEEEEEYLKVARGEDIKIACPVRSSPPPSYFRLLHLEF